MNGEAEYLTKEMQDAKHKELRLKNRKKKKKGKKQKTEKQKNQNKIFTGLAQQNGDNKKTIYDYEDKYINRNCPVCSREKKNEYKLRDLWDNTKSSGIHIILVSGGQRKNGVEKNVQIHKLTNARGSINPKLGNYKEMYASKHHNHTVGN